MSNGTLSQRATIFRTLVIATTSLLLASVASAELFTVTLKNGTSFDTRYKPVTAEWDPEVAMIMTDRGNWIALLKAEIADVISAAEAGGYGFQLDTTTLVLGWSPNDLYAENEEGEMIPTFETGEPDAGGGGLESFTIEQFVNPAPTGSPAQGGIPVTYGTLDSSTE